MIDFFKNKKIFKIFITIFVYILILFPIAAFAQKKSLSYNHPDDGIRIYNFKGFHFVNNSNLEKLKDTHLTLKYRYTLTDKDSTIYIAVFIYQNEDHRFFKMTSKDSLNYRLKGLFNAKTTKAYANWIHDREGKHSSRNVDVALKPNPIKADLGSVYREDNLYDYDNIRCYLTWYLLKKGGPIIEIFYLAVPSALNGLKKIVAKRMGKYQFIQYQ